MDHILTMSATKVSAFLHDIDAYGLTREHILHAAQLNPAVLQYPDHRITSVEFRRVLRETVRLTENVNIGLLQGEKFIKGFSNIAGYVLMNCATLGEAACKYCKYEKIVDGTSISQIHEDNGLIYLKCTMVDDVLKGCRQFSDFRIAGIISYTKFLSGKKVQPTEIHFSYPCPSDTSIYERMFNCPVLFNKASDMLAFKREDMERPVIEPNGNLLAVFEEIAQKSLKQLGVKGIYTEKVTDILLQEIKGETPTIGRTAGLLSMSVRSLQMCLRREGTSYSELVNEIRKEIAVNYLNDKTIPTDEIAYVLGFSETSAFLRAFKRWTRITPGEFRSR